MGNRAVITTKYDFENDGVGVYMHWNGGRDSVEPVLKYCELKGYRTPDKDNYGWARLCQVIGNALGGTSSLGIDKVSNLDCDNYDNGVYIIEDWKIVDRKYFEGPEQNEYDPHEMLKEIDLSMPESERLPEGFFDAEELPTSMICVGDTVFKYDNVYDRYDRCEVVGVGECRTVNGTAVEGRPYVNRYGKDDPENNINNYLMADKYWCIPAMPECTGQIRLDVD